MRMRSSASIALPKASPWEEAANSVTHGAGLVLSILGTSLLLATTALNGTLLHLIGCGVFGTTLVLMYAASTLYHGITAPHLKRIFRVLDHVAIYLFIAGSYTPFLLIHFGDSFGWALLVVIWSIALVGAVFKLFFTGRFARLSVALYIGMGWLIVLSADRLLEAVPPGCLAWLTAGGLLYTGGVVFFAWKRLPYNHAIWHLFVLAGSICHYIAVVRYIAPL